MAPSNIMVFTSPGIPRVSIGTNAPPVTALLEVSLAQTPSSWPWPKRSGFFARLFASPYAKNDAIVAPVPGRIPIKVPIAAERNTRNHFRGNCLTASNQSALILCTVPVSCPCPARRNASAVQNNPMVAGTSGIPMRISVMPKVNLGAGATGSNPIVDMRRPSPAAMMPFTTDLLVRAITTATAKKVRAKYSGPAK